MSSHFGSWSHDGLSNLQRKIAGVKTHFIKNFFISLEISWNVDVWNGFAWPIWTLKTQVMAKRKVGSQIANFLACRWCATYRWKAFNKGYKFALDLISIRGLHPKLWAPQSCGNPNFGNFGTPHLGVLGQNDIWMLVLWLSTKYIIKGEGGGFPQVRVVVSLVSSCLPMARPCTKVLQLHTNQLVVWFVQVRVSNWSACHSS
jgi:hypothetical protein